MIITITPNTGIDHTVQVPGFELNNTIRASGSAWGMGGKATDVSWILGKLGIATRALGFAGGPNGVRMEKMLRARGVETDFVWVDGETRLNTIIAIPGKGQTTITAASLDVSPDHLSEFVVRYKQTLEQASCLVVGGSLPQGVPLDFYAQVIAQAREQQVPVIFDSSGPSLVAGIKSQPSLIKPNLTELGDLLGFIPKSQQEIQQEATKLHQEFRTDVIVTMGNEGAVAVFETGSYWIEALTVPVVSAAGVGDGVLAGMALAYSQKESLEVGLRHGFALAGAILKTLATADFLIEDYQELLPQICITPLDC